MGVQGKPYVELRNATAVHARLTDVVVQQGSQSQPLADGLLGYVLPGASMRWPAPLVPNAGSVLKGRVNGQSSADAIRQSQ
ncbi:Type 1 pili usher pathway chaperone CsuC (fragment) [Pseudomonas inefficax]|uniref:Type 1 pili usher pathway chaperone CsuC n=1 Tax=Pseudomonas inefficax TaxID=2078786 RepID=A0AAQ1STX0_9PSED